MPNYCFDIKEQNLIILIFKDLTFNSLFFYPLQFLLKDSFLNIYEKDQESLEFLHNKLTIPFELLSKHTPILYLHIKNYKEHNMQIY